MDKLGIICGSLVRGGAERVAVYLAEYMKKRKIEVFLITSGKAENEYRAPEGVERINLSQSSNKFLTFAVQMKKINKIIKEKKIDTVLIMGVPLCIYSIPGCIFTNAKVIVSERNDPSNFAGKRIVKVISRYFMRMADGFVFQTSDAKKYYAGKLKGKGVIIPNPLLAKYLPEQYTGDREKMIVTSGRLIEQKNQKMLIHAFSEISERIPEYQLIIYGEGELRQELENEIIRLNMKGRVLLPGNVSDLHDRIRKASVFVLPSKFEGMPNALIEAMALGLPCITTDCPCGGPRELIEDGVNGVLIPVNSKELLEKAILEVVENPDYTRSLGEAAACIKNKLSVDKIGRQWFQYFTSL